MARGERLFDRLDELEIEYRKLVAAVCRDRIDHKFSKAAIRVLHPKMLAGKRWRDAQAARLEWFDKEIAGLRRKLSLPFSDSPVYELHRLRDALADRSDGECRRLIHDFIYRQSRMVSGKTTTHT